MLAGGMGRAPSITATSASHCLHQTVLHTHHTLAPVNIAENARNWCVYVTRRKNAKKVYSISGHRFYSFSTATRKG